MSFFLRQSARVMISCVLVMIFAVPPNLLAQATHVVSPAEIQRQVLSGSQARQHDLEAVRSLFSSAAGQRALQAAQVDPARLNSAVASLSDAELAQLASRAQKTQADFAAGSLSDRDLLFILLGIVALVLIIVAVR